VGWDENVQRTVNIIQDLQFEKGLDIDRVNLVGWSRGAVTCIRIAHMMYEVFKNTIECNIFAVDPVAGLDSGLTMSDTQILNTNVNCYIGILAMHERRESFRPQDWSRLSMDPSVTTAVMLPMPGVHNAQVITRNLACGFLRWLGSPITTVPYGHLSSPADMCEAYGRLVMSLSGHKEFQTKHGTSTIIGGGLRRRGFAKHSQMDLYTRGGKESYWINEHHRACFAAAYPKAYDVIFESTEGGTWARALIDVDTTLFRAMQTRTATRDSLIAKGLLSTDPYAVGVGGGHYTNQTVSAWPTFFPLHA
jgi:hypothetical protein